MVAGPSIWKASRKIHLAVSKIRDRSPGSSRMIQLMVDRRPISRSARQRQDEVESPGLDRFKVVAVRSDHEGPLRNALAGHRSAKFRTGIVSAAEKFACLAQEKVFGVRRRPERCEDSA